MVNQRVSLAALSAHLCRCTRQGVRVRLFNQSDLIRHCVAAHCDVTLTEKHVAAADKLAKSRLIFEDRNRTMAGVQHQVDDDPVGRHKHFCPQRNEVGSDT